MFHLCTAWKFHFIFPILSESGGSNVIGKKLNRKINQEKNNWNL